MLAVHILNVDHGDSIVLEHREDGESSFAVIDSNMRRGSPEVPALRKLQELGAKQVSFVALTHPHADHYLGLDQILRSFPGAVDCVFTFPVEQHVVGKRLRKLAQAHTKILGKSDSEEISRQTESFVTFLHEAKKIRWEAPEGLMTLLSVSGFSGVEFYSFLPPARVKGDFFNSLDKGTFVPGSDKLNDLSMGIVLRYRGCEILLAGDGTADNIMYQHKRLGATAVSLNPTAVKLQHHGSAKDCAEHVLDMVFPKKPLGDQEQFAFISANGQSHPSPEVLRYLRERGVKPYCTNLARTCGANAKTLVTASNNIDPKLLRFVNSIAENDSEIRQPCQGDISFRIEDNGVVKVERQYDHPCPYRGEYASLGLS